MYRIIQHELIKFLKKKHIYEQFMFNFKKQKHSRICKTFNNFIRKYGFEPRQLIDRAFIWSKTTEGFTYWRKVNDTWEQYFMVINNYPTYEKETDYMPPNYYIR